MLNFIFFALVSQTPTENVAPALPTPPPTTNSGEVFKDPFATEPESIPLPPSSPTPAPVPAPSTEGVAPAFPGVNGPSYNPSNPGTSGPSYSPSISGPSYVPSNPPSSPQAEPEFEEVNPNPLLPAAPTNPSPSPSTSIPGAKPDFKFPELDELKGPVTQEVVQRELSYIGTPVGAWNAGFAIGMGANVNKRHEQVHFEGNGGYRLREDLEIGGVLSYRFITDKLIGFIATGKKIWRITKAPSRRIDLAAGGGLGWTLRARSNTFTEGRFTLRAQGDAFFYVNPTMALTSAMAFEVFPFGITSDGEANNLMSSGGPPTQFILSVGMRWEY